jgi:hypothetical protein
MKHSWKCRVYTHLKYLRVCVMGVYTHVGMCYAHKQKPPKKRTHTKLSPTPQVRTHIKTMTHFGVVRVSPSQCHGLVCTGRGSR